MLMADSATVAAKDGKEGQGRVTEVSVGGGGLREGKKRRGDGDRMARKFE